MTVAIDFRRNTLEVNGVQQLFGFQYSLKYHLLCSVEESNSYRFGTTWRWVKWWPHFYVWGNYLFKTSDLIDNIHPDKFSYVGHKCTLSTGSNWDCNEIDWMEIVAIHLIIIWLLPAIHCLIFQWQALVSLWTLCTLPPNLLRLMYSAHSGTLSFRGHGNLWFAHSKSIKTLKGKRLHLCAELVFDGGLCYFKNWGLLCVDLLELSFKDSSWLGCD